MKVKLAVCMLVIIGFFDRIKIFEAAKAVQIITPVNHMFELELNDLKQVLEAHEIKNRHLMVFSIAGPSRKGKSYLLNFCLDFLYAKVTKMFDAIFLPFFISHFVP